MTLGVTTSHADSPCAFHRFAGSGDGRVRAISDPLRRVGFAPTRSSLEAVLHLLPLCLEPRETSARPRMEFRM